jgi:Mu-like prophage FluMu N-terminal domain
MSDTLQTPTPADGDKKTQKAKADGVRIISRKDGFRRAGVAHTGDVTHPAGTFSPAQLKLLKAEPLLTVIEFAGAPDAK